MPSLSLFRHDDDLLSVPSGEAIFEIDDPADCMYVVAEGALEIRIGDTMLERVETGGIVGEMAVVERLPRSATAIAVEDSKLAKIDQKRFLYLVQNHPFFAVEVMQVLANRLRKMDAELKNGVQRTG
ncbi:MAG: cyclic nucleotide-binding domain-containing protein [Candidatus Eremiobacteraeota bacterium]|nr:cyclic nucleotide-binding domain-containing protein [Candidatus Eremiobacteraeota bacterium]